MWTPCSLFRRIAKVGRNVGVKIAIFYEGLLLYLQVVSIYYILVCYPYHPFKLSPKRVYYDQFTKHYKYFYIIFSLKYTIALHWLQYYEYQRHVRERLGKQLFCSGLQNIHFHTFPFIFNYSFISERNCSS